MLLFAVEWIQNKKENPCFSLWRSRALKGTTLVLFVWSIKARSLFTSVMESLESLFWYTRKANETYDSPALSAWGFLIPQSPSTWAAKAGASIWMIPEELTQFSIPFTWGKKKAQKVLDLDLKIVQIHVLMVFLLQFTPLWTFDDSPKICCCLWSVMGKFQNSTFGHRNFRHPSCLTWWMTEKPSTLLLLKVLCKPTLRGSSYLGHDIAFFVKTSSALWLVQCSAFQKVVIGPTVLYLEEFYY